MNNELRNVKDMNNAYGARNSESAPNTAHTPPSADDINDALAAKIEQIQRVRRKRKIKWMVRYVGAFMTAYSGGYLTAEFRDWHVWLWALLVSTFVFSVCFPDPE